MQTLLLLGSLNMALVVVLGAFGGHILKKKLPSEKLKIYETGIHYHIAHALALLLIGVLPVGIADTGLAAVAGWLLLAGIVLFCGSLYVIALKGIKRLGPVTPLGGLFFIAGWIVLAVAVLQG